MAIVLDGTSGISSPAINAGNIVGQVCFFGMTTAPAGFLKANGAAISRTIYADLFAAIGTTYGAGDGSTTFALPDMRGEFPRGWDDGRGIDASRALGSAQLDQMQQLTGTFDTGTGNSGARPIGGTASGAFTINRLTQTNYIQTTTFSSSLYTGSVGFDSASSPSARAGAETRSRNVALLACIKF